MKTSNHSAFETRDQARFEHNLFTECRRNDFDGVELNPETLLGNAPKATENGIFDDGEEKFEVGTTAEMLGAVAVSR